MWGRIIGRLSLSKIKVCFSFECLQRTTFVRYFLFPTIIHVIKRSLETVLSTRRSLHLCNLITINTCLLLLKIFTVLYRRNQYKVNSHSLTLLYLVAFTFILFWSISIVLLEDCKKNLYCFYHESIFVYHLHMLHFTGFKVCINGSNYLWLIN